MPTVETTVATIAHLLSSHGPMTADELIDALAAEGIDLGSGTPVEELYAILDEGDEVVLPLSDGRLAWLPGLLDGCILTHRVGELEVEHDVLELGADLTAVAMLTENETYRTLLDGSPIVDASSQLGTELLDERGVPTPLATAEEAWLLPSGYLTGLGVAAGDLVGVRVTDVGFEILSVDTVQKSTAVAAIAARLGEQPDRPDMINSSVWTVRDKHKDAFREPIAPLGELFTTMGLVMDGEWIAPAGFDFDLWRASLRIGDLMTRHDLDLDEAAAVWTTLMLHERIRDRVDAVFADSTGDDWGDDGAPSSHLLQTAQAAANDPDFEADTAFMDVRDALDFFDEPIVVEAFLSEASSSDLFTAHSLVVFTEVFERVAPRAARPALLWLRGRAHEHVGKIDLAEQAFRSAEALDSSWPLTLMSLARMASDRGDAERGLSLLRRAGTLPDAPLVRMLEAFQPVPHHIPARNDPCWCGSGRKYKQCHLHREQLALADRAAWLYQKAITDLLAGPSAAFLTDVAHWRSEHWDAPDGLERAVSDDLTLDVVLFEGGAFADFLALRGRLLPADEALLAAEWLAVERSVHDVVGVRPGESITLRDMRTGDVQEVRAPAASERVQPGELYCTRVLPAGDTLQILGGLEPVSPEDCDSLLALLDDQADPMEIVEFLSRGSAPLEPEDTDG